MPERTTSRAPGAGTVHVGKEFSMSHTKSICWFPVLALTMSVAGAMQKGKTRLELPAAVVKAIEQNRPGAAISKLEVAKEGGVTLYDIEFKEGKGEIEVAEDGSVIDIATIVKIEDIPRAAAAAIQRVAAGAIIKQVEKSEVRAEAKNGKVIKLASPRCVYQAELVKDRQTVEIQVAPDGQVIEEPKWKN